MAAGKANPLYGAISPDQKRFDIAQDPRRMYPVMAFGKLYGKEMVPNRLQQGSTGFFGKPTTNLIPIGDGTTLASIGNPEEISSAKKTIRLGVTGTSGGDFTGAADFSFVFANRLMTEIPTNLYVLMSSGEAVYRETDASINQYGAISEAFTVGGVTITGTSGTPTITASANWNTLNLTTAYTLTRSMAHPQIGDVIRVNYDNGTFAYHRITSITNAVATIAPDLIAAVTAKTFQLLRTGLRSMSRIATVINLPTTNPPSSTTGVAFYNYYCGNAADLLVTPGTIQCWKQNIDGTGLAHYMAPQTVDTTGAATGFDIKAKDLVLYKDFLLFGYGNSIGWSRAGFPSSFTFGFGDTDFPAENINVVARDDEFMSFEMLGENVIAIFKNSVWQVRASGTVPEFNFYRLVEPVGSFATYVERNSTSARGTIYYKTTDGVVELSGQMAKKISDPIRSLTSQADMGNLSWEPTTDTLIINSSSVLGVGWYYHIPSESWSRFDLTAIGFSPIIARDITGNINSIRSCMQAGFFNLFTHTVYFLDGRDDGPAGVGVAATAKWTWSSPVISLGDDYAGFKLGGFQVEGNANVDWELYGGPDPTHMTLRQTGSGATTGNRIPLGKKVDDPFIQIVLYSQLLIDSYYPGLIYGVNLYQEMGGR